MASSKPGPWKALGCGSIRREGKDLWRVNYRPRGARGKRVNRLVECSEAEARALVLAASVDRNRRRAGLAPRLTWDGALQAFAAHLAASELTEKHVADLTGVLEAFREDTGLEVDEVQVQDVQGWLDAQAAAARKAKRHGWARTSNRKRAYLHRFFRWLHRLGHIPANPVAGTFQKKETRRPPRDLTPGDYGKVWAVCEPQLRDLLDFLLLTGARFGEVRKMKRADVAGGVWTIPARKGGDFLKIPLGALLVEILLRQPAVLVDGELDGLVWHKWTAPGTGSKPPQVFPAGDPVTDSWLRTLLHERCRRAKVEPFSAHALRHALATWARGQGLPMAHIQDALGHASVRTTEIYAHAGALDGIKMVQETLQKLRDGAVSAAAPSSQQA